MLEARAKSPPSNRRMSSGSTGAMMPNARKSNATMMRMKMNAPPPTLGAGVVVGSAIQQRNLLDFENHGKNQRPLGSLLVDVTFEVHANLFLDDAPVGFFLGVRLLDGLHNHNSRADDQFLAVVAHQSARHYFRM